MRVGFGFSSVTFRPSRVFHFRVFNRPSAHTDEQSTGKCPHFYQAFKMLYAFISLLYKQLLQYTLLKSHHCTIRFINQISKEVLYETFRISFYFHKIVHENTLL